MIKSERKTLLNNLKWLYYLGYQMGNLKLGQITIQFSEQELFATITIVSLLQTSQLNEFIRNDLRIKKKCVSISDDYRGVVTC